MKPSRLLSLVLLVLFVFATSIAMGRTWTDKFGKSIQAKFIRFHDGKVVLKRGNKVIKISFDELSEEDQDFVRDELEKKGQADLLPPKVSPDAFDDNASDGIGIEPDEERTWTDVKGREIRAKMLRLTDDGVVLLYKGREVTVPLERLIPADREYAKKRAEKRRIAKQSPPPVLQAPIPHSTPTPRHSPSPRQPLQIPKHEPPKYVPPKYEPPKFEPTPMPRHDPPVMPHMNTPPDIPSPSQSFFPRKQEMGYFCSKCNKLLPSNIGVGDHCPYCGAFLAYEEDEHGNVTKRASTWRYVGFGGIIPIIALALGLLFRFLKSD